MLTAIIFGITPFLVNAITGIIKSLPTFSDLIVSRKPVVRTIAAVVSLVYVSLGLWLEPGSVSDDAITTATGTVGLAFVTWLSSLGSYHAFFDKN